MAIAKNQLSGKYFIRKKNTNTWEDFTTKFKGLKILKIDGMTEVGDAVNVYNEQWVNSKKEDFMVTTQIDGSDVIIRKNVDLELTFICGERYGAQDTQTLHGNFIDWVANYGDFYIRSDYAKKQAHVICLKAYKPTVQKLHRGSNSYIMGTITLHCIEPPTGV